MLNQILYTLPLNATNESLWNKSFSPFTDMFKEWFGVGETFFIFPLIVLCVALYVKTRSPVMVTMFMIAAGALGGSAGLFLGVAGLSTIMYIFMAIGIAGLFISLFYGS